ncbi:LRR receptor-like serine threonine-protein kinase [Seminavis robusta]|uniref:LRR receptor-like serine threonine-protein kinase n=1 Tax=Seminavis robusta TaxID=568900 RepID=A0A9N8HYH9_9STRA|nr:LRR receptor-like serine threonine-protein kinase [Seminavis robusta]|eukprot:Sro2506_g329680.1 LRR receptor-like serine threonine-protein kinase (663) ;mRNA; f:9956-12700
MATPQPMQDDSLIRALENEQQYEDTGSDEGLPPVPTEVSHGHRQPGQDTDVETCVSSVTDVLQNADLFVDHMYPTLNAVVEEEESHSNLVLKSLNKNLAPTISTTTTEETQRQQTSQNQQHESSGDMLKSLNENSNHAPTISSFGTATGDTQGQKTLTFQNGQHDSSGDKSLNQSAAKEELQSNEAAVLKAAKMDKDDQASSAASIAGIGSKKPSAVNISDQQQEVQKGQKDQKDLPPKQGKPEANLQSKETATNSINPTSAVGVVESSGSDVQAEMQAPQQQPALIRIHRHPVSFPGAYSIDGIGTSSGIGASNDDGRIVPVPPSTGRAELSNLNGNLDSSLNDFLIPRMTQLRYLAYMDLSLNGLVGTLPTEFGLINQLTEFSASANAITGTIPSELGQLTLMRSLQLSANSLVGTLPSELWLLTSLENLNLGSNAAGNYLTGRLPSEIGSLNSLQQLSLSKNLFTGEIPSEYGLLTSLESILLFDNFLSGGLPSEVGTMAMLRHVLIQGNMLSGLLPNELQELTALEWLKLESNNISGGILSELGLLTGLLDLRLGSNQFLGGIPTELGQLLSLQELDLADLMMLTGFVPSEFVLMASLGWLNISGSVGLSGTMPDELCFFQNASCTYIWGTKPCFLGFDCTDQLCGCDCLCSNETSNE